MRRRATQFTELSSHPGLAQKRQTGPDIALRFSIGEVELFEVVEADQTGRSRGREYRISSGQKPLVADWPVEEWATPEQCFAAVRAKAHVKASKAQKLRDGGTPYPPDTRLLILLNLADFGAHQEDIEAIFQSAIEPARPWFRSVWILWQGKAYQP